jgi:hypothetical protein
MRSGFTIETEDGRQLLNDLVQEIHLPFSKNSPNILHKDHADEKANENWMQRVFEWVEPKHPVASLWGEEYEDDRINFKTDSPISVTLNDFDAFKFKFFEIFKNLNFKIISIGDAYSEWSDIEYNILGFSDGHNILGMGCAFRGTGHQRIVSHRWLDYGPFLVTRDEENDISLIQFHDLEADALTALEQAKPGHEWMRGRKGVGGFIQRDYNILSDNFAPLYEADTKMIKIVVYGREVTKAEMLDACATRYWQLLGTDKPVERAAFVFIDETEARAILFELWLRELECYAIIKGVETRLDLNYVPLTPVKPDWVNRIKDTDATQEKSSRKS